MKDPEKMKRLIAEYSSTEGLLLVLFQRRFLLLVDHVVAREHIQLPHGGCETRAGQVSERSLFENDGVLHACLRRQADCHRSI